MRPVRLTHRKRNKLFADEGAIPPSLRIRARALLSPLSNPTLMSKKRDETLRRGLCRVFMSLDRVRTAEPHWLGLSKPLAQAARRRRDAIILSRIFEKVLIRTIILQEAGDSQEGFPGLSRMIPLEPFNEAGWYPMLTSGERSCRRIKGLVLLTCFQVE